MTGKKLAVLVPVSQEVAMTNPAGMYDQVSQRPPDRAGPRVRLRRDQRQVAAHRRAGPFPEYLAQARTPSRSAPPPPTRAASTPTS
jgi:hypothetical protein